MVIAAIPTIVTTPVALVTLIGGVALAAVGPIVVRRMARASASATVSPAARWAVVFIVEIVAVALLFTAGHAFGVIPQLATALKVAVIAAIAVVLAGIAGIVQRS